MTPEKLREIIATKEGTEIEFKTSRESLSGRSMNRYVRSLIVEVVILYWV